MDAWGRVYRRAVRQYGVITTTQAFEEGLDPSALRRRVGREGWTRRHRRVYVVPGFESGALTEIAAAVHAVRAPALVTGEAGLFLHGIVDRPPRRPTVVVAHGSYAPRLADVTVVHSRTLAESDRSIVRDLPTAIPQRCLLDAARDAPRRHMRGLLIDARQRGVVTPAQVVGYLGPLSPRVPGRELLLASALDVDRVGADSVLSDLVHRRLIAAGLLPDATPTEIVVDGRQLHPDITFQRARVCIECDSLAFHRTQRAIDLDHRKDHAYSQARWRCLRIGWRRFDKDWSGFVDDVREALAEWPRVVAALRG